ncbi:hypothetical protein [Pseudomonas tolaasii]|uniref:hypothetical protein n=1 Tax=Pseudomonas tolaasii TaxID=29442 RepID=UPI000360853F|nr:hypothetical protein [Pseudomonas tolaasii]
MRKTVFPKKLYFLIAIAILGAVLACLSRAATHLPIRGMFKAIGFGNASLIEHFLAGFAFPAAFGLLLIHLMPLASKFIKSPIRILALVKLQRWLMTRSRPIYITHWTTVIACIYGVASFQWEASQIEVHGFFQLDQFCMDLAGAFAFCASMWAILEKNRQRAKAQRSFSLV